jgi:hypothetical protein
MSVELNILWRTRFYCSILRITELSKRTNSVSLPIDQLTQIKPC